jgi:hypothetical protein
MISRRLFLETIAATTAGIWAGTGPAGNFLAQGIPELASGFGNPPDTARPWVYWIWINGNLTREGITADLEAMQRVGIGGVLIFEVDPGTPAGDVPFNSAAWREMFQFACQEVHRLGLEINLCNAAGWAGSAGPWITPELSMQKVVWSEISAQGPGGIEQTLPTPEQQEGYYRDIAVLAFPTPADDAYRIPEIDFKAAFETRSTPYDTQYGVPIYPNAIPSLPAASRIERDKIQDLSAHCNNGRLTWEVPEGKWTIVRFGYTTTGMKNHPTPETGLGLECDKLSKAAIELQFSKFIGELVAQVGPLAGSTFVATHIDSWESGSQNWTPKFGEEFRKRCGYDILPLLPVLTGRAVGDLEIAERFLWDFRKVIGDLLNENYAGRLRELAHEKGLRLSIEAYDWDPADDMGYAGQADEPQGEFWYVRDNYPDIYRSWSWCLNMASAAHVYGKRIVAAEAFTAYPGENWQAHPASLKPLGDWAFCAGINRFDIHRYAMQPWKDRKPGMTMGPWGQHYERTETWWEESKDWHTYLTRCQFLLRQGWFVADLCYLQPEGAPMRFRPPGVDQRSADPPDPPGYNFDGCTPEVVLTRMSVKDGRILLPDGMSYRILVLPEPGDMPGAGTMTPQLLRKIAELVEQGMIVVGPRPSRSPSLSNYPSCDLEVQEISDRLWGDCDGVHVLEHRLGKGRVVWGPTPQQVLAGMGVPVDFSSGTQSSFRYIHRRMEDGTEIYFVANKKNLPVEEICTFRVGGRRPEFWWPQTGQIERPAIYEEKDGRIVVPLHLPEHGSAFVVFPAASALEADRIATVRYNGRVLTETAEHIRIARGKNGTIESLAWQPGEYVLRNADGKESRMEISLPDPVAITGPWHVHFAPNWGAPEHIVLPNLISWTEHVDPGVRYFSGKATYKREIQIPSSLVQPGLRLFLDLGGAEVIAIVKWNEINLGVLWKPPFRMDITEAARAGLNSAEITVVNTWPNRLIGDANLPEDCEWEAVPHTEIFGQKLAKWPAWLLEGKSSPTGRFTFTTWKLWHPNDQLLRSGLLGPVTLSAAARVTSSLNG